MDVAALRAMIPALDADAPITYLDNACMTLRPQPVIDRIADYYSRTPSCGGRSVHRWGMEVSRGVAASRRRLARFIGADEARGLAFTANATASMNMVAQGLDWQAGDVVITSDREHNSNLIPWQRLAARGVEHVRIPCRDDNTWDEEAYEAAVAAAGSRLKLVSLVHVGNLDGVMIPVEDCVGPAHDVGALVHVDGAQSAPHMPIDVSAMDVDFFSFSLHKMLGPSGLGALWGRPELMDELEPMIAGGGTVRSADATSHTFGASPARHEAGLGNYAGILAAEAAVDVLESLDMAEIAAHEIRINRIMSEGVANLPGVSIIGPEDAAQRGGICSILFDKIDPQDVGILLDESAGVFVRAGMHCVNQWFDSRGEERGSLRASAYAYNTEEDAKRFVEAMTEIVEALG